MRGLKSLFGLLLLLVVFPNASAFSFMTIDGTPLVDYSVRANQNGTSAYFYVSQEHVSDSYVRDFPVQFVLDDADTPGRDYATDLLEEYQPNYMVFAIGTVQGTVVDRYQNSLAQANVAVSCLGYPIIKSETVTDDYGFFSIDAPVGTCTVHARQEGVVDNEQVVVSQGQLHTVNIVLNSSQVVLQSSQDDGLSFTDLVILTFLSIIVIVILLALKGIKHVDHNGVHALPPKKEAKTHAQEINVKEQVSTAAPVSQNNELSEKAQGVMKTLNAREKEIVHVLLEKGEQSQTQLQYATGIPKATVSRIIQKLSTTEVITIQEYGKTKKISLNSWFHSE